MNPGSAVSRVTDCAMQPVIGMKGGKRWWEDGVGLKKFEWASLFCLIENGR